MIYQKAAWQTSMNIINSCDIVPELVQYLTPAGRDFLQQECEEIREQMIEVLTLCKK